MDKRFGFFLAISFVFLSVLGALYFYIGYVVTTTAPEILLGPGPNASLNYTKAIVPFANYIDVRNPIITGDRPDPGVIRVLDSYDNPGYYLVHTIHDGRTSTNGDIPMFVSSNLANWTERSYGAFNRTKPRQDGPSLHVNTADYCNIWAPEIFTNNDPHGGWFMLSYTATRHQSGLDDCYSQAWPPNLGVYLAYTDNLNKGFAWPDHPWESLPAGPASSCSLRAQLPHSVDYQVGSERMDCGGRRGVACSNLIRLDSNAWKDPLTGKQWLAYVWTTNFNGSFVSQDVPYQGNDVSIVQLGADPFVVQCNISVPRVLAGVPHDNVTLNRLRTYCPRCGEMLSMTSDYYGGQATYLGNPSGVNEAPNLFRRGNYVYLMMSGSGWNTPYYNVFWVAAPTVEQLVYNNPNRLVGRYIIPNLNQSFGHGSAVLGPDGQHWYYVYHHLNMSTCQPSGVGCNRDIWTSEIQFQDCPSGGPRDACIKAIFPAENSSTRIYLLGN